MSEARFRIGIDEAGYGPRLGPLVIGLVRTDGSGVGLSEALLRGFEGTPRICDSKQLFRGNLARLEVTALAALACARGERPKTLAALLGQRPEGLSAHPWYEDLDLRLPVAADPRDVDRAAIALFKTLKSSSVWLEAAEVRPMLEGEFNGRLESGVNKAQLELEVIEDLLTEHIPPHPRGLVYCDRLGGRKSYDEWLLGQFPFWGLEVEAEDAAESVYWLRKGRYALGFHFFVGGEARVPEIALASCLAKYTRELMMALFNRFWTGRKTEVRPTAGYPTDARRFLSELAGDDMLEAHRELLVRRR